MLRGASYAETDVDWRDLEMELWIATLRNLGKLVCTLRRVLAAQGLLLLERIGQAIARNWGNGGPTGYRDELHP